MKIVSFNINGLRARPHQLQALIEKHQVTHLKVVPALLIRLINDPAVENYNLSSLKLIQSGGQRMQPEVRAKTRAARRNGMRPLSLAAQQSAGDSSP